MRRCITDPLENSTSVRPSSGCEVRIPSPCREAKPSHARTDTCGDHAAANNCWWGSWCGSQSMIARVRVPSVLGRLMPGRPMRYAEAAARSDQDSPGTVTAANVRGAWPRRVKRMLMESSLANGETEGSCVVPDDASDEESADASGEVLDTGACAGPFARPCGVAVPVGATSMCSMWPSSCNKHWMLAAQFKEPKAAASDALVASAVWALTASAVALAAGPVECSDIAHSILTTVPPRTDNVRHA